MSPKTRKILLIIFVLLFFTISPLLVIYAFGYELNWQTKRLQKTGMFIIETKPSNALVYIDGELQKKSFSSSPLTTPTKIKGVFPGDYQIKIELDGYWPWEKRLTIKPSETVFIEDVRLFNQVLPLKITSLEISDNRQVATSPNQKYQAVLNNNKLILINLETQEKNLWYEFVGQQPTNLSWSPSGQQLIVDQLLFNIELNNSFTDLEPLLKTNAYLLKWHNDQTLTYIANNKIYSFDITNQTNKVLYSQTSNLLADDYLFTNNHLYFTTKNQKSSLIAVDLINNQKQTMDLPVIGNHEFTQSENKWLNLHNTQDNKLYIIDAKQLSLKQTLSCGCYKWIDQQRLVYTNGFEIWISDIENNKKRLITRVSEQISDIIWHPSNNYIIYSTSQKINSLEVDNRNRHHTNKLLEVNDITNLEMSPNGNQLFFHATIGQQSGLYQLAI